MSPQQRQVIEALRAAGDRGVTTHDFLSLRPPVARFSSRIEELGREYGYVITPGKRLTASDYIYFLVNEPTTSPRRETRSPQEERQPSGPAFDGSRPEGVGTLFDMPTPRISAVTGRDIQTEAA